MSSWTKELDEAVVLATSRGCHHVRLFYLLCALAAIPTAFLAFSQVFTSATPAHWCAPPPELLPLNLTAEQLRSLSVPHAQSCRMYDIDIVGLHRLFPEYIEESSQVHVEKGMMKIVKVKQFTLSAGDRREEELETVRAAVHNGSWPVVPCRYGWVFDTQYYDRTLVTDLELVCERGWWPRTSTSLFWVGSIFGNLLFGWLSDRWGRRPTILLMVFAEVPLAIATSFARDYATFTALRVAGGLFFPALYQVPFILALELMPPCRRTYTGMVIGMMFASAMCVLALLAYMLRDWFALSLATSVPFLVLYSYYWLVPESPRWLVSRGRVADAEKVLRRLALANGIELEHGFLLKLHKEFKETESVDPGIVALPITQMNGHVVGFPEDTDKDIPRTIDRRLTHMQTFKPDLNKIPEMEVETTKTTDIERMIAFEVAEIVNRKSRLKKNEVQNKEETTLLTNIKVTDSVTNTEDTDRIVEECNDESQNESNAKQKCTQTEPVTKSPSDTLRRKSIHLVNKILWKEELSGLEMDLQIEADKKIDEQCSEGDCEATPLDVLRYPNIRKKFLILTFDWIANAVVYNGLSYNTSNLGVNDYLAFFIGGAVELPSYCIAWKSMDRFGRRWVLCVSMCVGGLACLSCVLVPEDNPWVRVALAMVGRLCVAASFAVFYVFVGELLPTVLRAQAMAASSFLAGLGLLAVPYIVHLAVYSRVLPLAIMGTLSLAGGAASLFLPETLHQPLPQTVRDGENFGAQFRILSCPGSGRTEEGIASQ